MYGKSFESMYEGSLVGAGFHVWAVWNYVITKTHFSSVELNPRLLAFTLAGDDPEGESKVRQAIDILCAPDPESRTKEEEGRRLIREGQFQYRVVNWEKYQVIKSKEVLSEYNRVKKAESRAKKKAAAQARAKTPEEHLAEMAAHDRACEANKALNEMQLRHEQACESEPEYHPEEPPTA